MNKLEDLTKKELKRLYQEEKLSAAAIGKLYSCSDVTILNRMKKFDIPRNSFHNILGQVDKVTLEDLYWNKKMSLREIGKHFDCSSSTVRKRMQTLNIERRTFTEAQEIIWEQRPGAKRIEAFNSQIQEDRAKVKRGVYIERNWLYTHYIEEKESMAHMAEIFGCSSYYIKKSLLHCNIPIRSKKTPLPIIKKYNVIQLPINIKDIAIKKDEEKVSKKSFSPFASLRNFSRRKLREFILEENNKQELTKLS